MALKFRQTALDDLDSIWDYTVDRWGHAQGETYLRALHQCCVELSTGVRRGLDSAHIRKNYRRCLIGRHVVFYQKNGDVIIHRILHQSMDVPNQL